MFSRRTLFLLFFSLFCAGTAFAQQWDDFKGHWPQYRIDSVLTIRFPGTPKITDSADLLAHLVERPEDGVEFYVTRVDLNGTAIFEDSVYLAEHDIDVEKEMLNSYAVYKAKRRVLVSRSKWKHKGIKGIECVTLIGEHVEREPGEPYSPSIFLVEKMFFLNKRAYCIAYQFIGWSIRTDVDKIRKKYYDSMILNVD